MFFGKIEKNEFFEKNISVYERSQNGVEINICECEPMKNKFAINDFQENILDIFLSIGEGRVY